MRILSLCALAAVAFANHPVSDEQAAEALARFQEAFQAKDVEAKQNAVYNLHDVPHDLVLKELEKLLKHKDPSVRNVAALAVGGQKHAPKRAGDLLMKSYQKDYASEEVLSSVLEAMSELKYMGYWPTAKAAFKDTRNVIVVGVIELIGANQDWRAFPDLVELYREIMPRRVTWSTGEVTVDTGAPDDSDQKAAEAAFNKKYGQGGSKEKAKAKAKANSYDLRNFSTQLRKCVKQITGQDFDNAFDLEEWWCENYLMVAKKIAEMEGKDPESVVPRAKAEQEALRLRIEEERKRMEEEVARRREEEKAKK
jgi:hypothetical protein